MGTKPGTLTYPGDLEHAFQVGTLHGFNELYQAFEILDVETYREGDPATPSSPPEEAFCGLDERTDTHTHVHLQLARPDTVKEQLPAYAADMRRRGLL